MTTLERLPPHSIEAEEAVLGSLLIDPDAILDVASFLNPTSFSREKNRWVYEAMRDLHEEREPIDFITLSEMLRQRGQLEPIGGEAFLIGLLNVVPTSINAESYARLVESAALRRNLIKAASKIADLAYDEAEDISIVIDRAEQTLFSVSEGRNARDLKSVRDIADEYLDRIQELHARGEEMIGIPTGFTDIDKMLGGLNKSDLLIIAARPGMGKCVTGDTRLVNPNTGEWLTIDKAVERQQGAVLTLTDQFRLQKTQASDFLYDGIKPVYKVCTALGREIRVTLSHPFRTVMGWQPLSELKVGSAVAVPRCLPIFGTDSPPDYEVKVLAYMLADGSVRGSSPQFSNTNPILRDDFISSALQFPGNKARLESSKGTRTPTVYITGDRSSMQSERLHFATQVRERMAQLALPSKRVAEAVGVSPSSVSHWCSGRVMPDPEHFTELCLVLKVDEGVLAPAGISALNRKHNSLTTWLKQQNLWGQTAPDKDIPPAVFRYTRPKLALFLNRLFACDGSLYIQNSTQPVVSYMTASRKLATSLQHLLLRFGLIAKLRHRQIAYQDGYRPAYQLRLTGANNVAQFIEKIGAFGKEAVSQKIRALCDQTIANTNTDTIPVEIWETIKQAKGPQTWADLHRKMGLPANHNMHVGQRAPSRQRLLAIGQALENEHLIDLAQSDVYWDKIVSIDFVGHQPVYDLTVPHTHNFVANDIVVHNTSLLLNLVFNAGLKHGKRIAMFNLEMSGEQLVQRMISAQTRIDSQRLRRGQLREEEWPIFYEAVGRLSETRIFIDDTPSITPMQLRTKCRRLYAEHGLDLIIIDYLQLMQSERSTNNRVQEISEISRALKGLARELDVPLIAAAQLSRAVENRQDKRPQLSDLRDSGSIEQDSDIVMFIYRDEYYNPETTERPNIAEISIAKHRHGPTGVVDLFWHANLATFRNLQRQEVNL